MDPFTEIEQEVTDLTWYAIDAEGRIGHFTTGGSMLLPPSITESKEVLERINTYFCTLPIFRESNYVVCPDLTTHIDKRLITDMNGYVKPSAEMSARGLYSYDNHPTSNERPYFRVTIPKTELQLKNLPEDIKSILQSLRMNEINFAQDSVITKEITDKL